MYSRFLTTALLSLSPPLSARYTPITSISVVSIGLIPRSTTDSLVSVLLYIFENDITTAYRTNIAGKAVNIRLLSADNNTIGAWFIFSEKIYRELPYPPPDNVDFSHPRRKLIPSALRRVPTILYLHGNTGTRAHFLRTSFYTTLTARLGANVLSVDYRGYGDSEGDPSVQGVSRDARTAWDYLISQGADPSDIIVLGHSLGSAIAGILSAELSREGIRPRGTVLMAVGTLKKSSYTRR